MSLTPNTCVPVKKRSQKGVIPILPFFDTGELSHKIQTMSWKMWIIITATITSATLAPLLVNLRYCYAERFRSVDRENKEILDPKAKMMEYIVSNSRAY